MLVRIAALQRAHVLFFSPSNTLLTLPRLACQRPFQSLPNASQGGPSTQLPPFCVLPAEAILTFGTNRHRDAVGPCAARRISGRNATQTVLIHDSNLGLGSDTDCFHHAFMPEPIVRYHYQIDSARMKRRRFTFHETRHLPHSSEVCKSRRSYGGGAQFALAHRPQRIG